MEHTNHHTHAHNKASAIDSPYGGLVCDPIITKSKLKRDQSLTLCLWLGIWHTAGVRCGGNGGKLRGGEAAALRGVAAEKFPSVLNIT